MRAARAVGCGSFAAVFLLAGGCAGSGSVDDTDRSCGTRCTRALDAGTRPAGDPEGPASPDEGSCTVGSVPSAFEHPSLEHHWRGAGTPFPELEQVLMTPIVVDWIEDGPDDTVPEIVFVSYDTVHGNAVLRVLRTRPPYETVMTLAGDGTGPVPIGGTATPLLQFDSHPAAGDLDGDGVAEVVVVLKRGGVVALRSDGSDYWRTDFSRDERGVGPAVALADLAHDGRPEVIIGAMVFDGQTGAHRWTGADGRGYNRQGPISCVADVVPGGSLEIVAGRTVYDADGRVVWTVEVEDAAEPSRQEDGFCAIADVLAGRNRPGSDGDPEVIRVADGTLTVHRGSDGRSLWSMPIPACGSREAGRGGAPTVADFDGDGEVEIGLAGASCYTVFDRACDGSPPPAGCFGPGILWKRRTDDESSNVTSSTVFDFNGDGRAEVIYNDENHFMVLDGRDGTLIFRDPNPSRTHTEQPVVADVDNDGHAEIVFAANTEAYFAGDGIPLDERVPGLEIWSSADDSWVGARPVWNQHTYHVTNVGDRGEIPMHEDASWEGDNTYRRNVAEGNPLAAPNLRVDVGAVDLSACGTARVTVCARVINVGEATVGPGLAVALYDGEPSAGGALIGTTRTTRNLDPGGGSEEVCVDWVPAPVEPRTVWAVVDAEDRERECHEDDNAAAVGEASCPPLE